LELDKDRLAKLLSLTDSKHDGEALSAIRKSNELLKLHKTTWHEVMGLSSPAEPPPPPEPAAASARAERPAELLPGFAFAKDYRNVFRQEPLFPRLLAFAFWIVLELLALVLPRLIINKRGRMISITFALCLLVSGAFWIYVGYYLVFVIAG